MPVHPYDEQAAVVQNKSIKKDKYNNTKVILGMHIGTHIDAPKHLISSGKGIEEYDLSHFMGKACVIDVSNETIIELKEEYKQKICNNDVVLIYTGYGECFTKEVYYSEDVPVLTKEFAEYLSREQIKMVGIDLPSPDKYPFEIHKILLSNNVLIIENLTNLDKLLDVNNFTFSAIPLNIDAEASLTRAIAIIK